jgi:hypothetical protein
LDYASVSVSSLQAQSIYHNLVSLMAVIALLKIFSCRRWAKAMTAGNKPPAILIKELKKNHVDGKGAWAECACKSASSSV